MQIQNSNQNQNMVSVLDMALIMINCLLLYKKKLPKTKREEYIMVGGISYRGSILLRYAI
jgi:hypothetical protein